MKVDIYFRKSWKIHWMFCRTYSFGFEFVEKSNLSETKRSTTNFGQSDFHLLTYLILFVLGST